MGTRDDVEHVPLFAVRGGRQDGPDVEESGMEAIVGIDVGSVAVKAVLVAGEKPIGWLKEPTGPNIARQCESLLQRLCQSCDVHAQEAAKVCSTGYGRNLVRGAHGQVSEILANAAGAGWCWRNWEELEQVFGASPLPAAAPGRFRTIVDVGGQDSKVITFAPDGLVDQFVMNDRCAAGTGRFLEVMARVLEVDLARLDELALGCDRPCRISSACTVFAESEVISLLSEGADKGNVAAGIFESVAGRVAGLAAQIAYSGPILFDGGPSHSRALVQALGRELGSVPAVPPCADFVTALGAAMLSSSHLVRSSDAQAFRPQGQQGN